MGLIRDLKGVQKVLGCLAALSRFISRLGEKGLPLYRLLKKHERFSWTVEAQEALDKIKATLAHAPILTPPRDGEPLYLSSFPLGEIIRNPDAAGRIAKWSVELMGKTLAYVSCKTIKSQILADFVAEWTDTQLPLPQIQAECWTLYFDGSLMKTGEGAGLLFISPLGEHMRYSVHLHFPASNNMAEYEALLCGLRIAIEMGIKSLDVRRDSQLVIDHVMKKASCHDDKMEAYCNAVRALEDKFYGIELNHVPRRYNEEADELGKIASG
jgi:ribonuclease HI